MSLLKSVKTANISNAFTDLYIAPAGKVGILVGGNIANKIDSVITVDISVESGGTSYVLLKGLAIPPNAAFSFSGLEQKFVVGTGDKIKAKSSANNSADALLSISELEA